MRKLIAKWFGFDKEIEKYINQYIEDGKRIDELIQENLDLQNIIDELDSNK